MAQQCLRGTAGTPKLRAVLFCRACHSRGSLGGFFYLEGINPLLCLTAPRLPWPQAAWTVSQAGFGLTLLWASSALYRIIKYLLEMGEGKAALDALFVYFSSPLKAEKMWSEVPVSHEVFGSQYPRRAWEQATQRTLLFRSLNAVFTTKDTQQPISRKEEPSWTLKSKGGTGFRHVDDLLVFAVAYLHLLTAEKLPGLQLKASAYMHVLYRESNTDVEDATRWLETRLWSPSTPFGTRSTSDSILKPCQCYVHFHSFPSFSKYWTTFLYFIFLSIWEGDNF